MLFEDRETQLAPERVAAWADVVRRAAVGGAVGRRPCAYGPWSTAVSQMRDVPRVLVTQDADASALPDRLIWFYATLAQPGWACARRDFIEAALVFLEADVMLFRSGYAKRHLIRRLAQSPLSAEDIVRIEGLLKRAVLQGTGLEEHRAYRKLAARLVCEGRLPGLCDWLEGQARGAILTWDRATGAVVADLLSAQLSPQDRARLETTSFRLGAKWGLPYPSLDRLVPARHALRDAEAKRRFSAYLMVKAIRARQLNMTTH